MGRRLARVAVTCTLLTCATRPAAADDDLVRVGARLGVNAAAVDLPEDSNTGEAVTSRQGITVGGFVRIAPAAHIAIEIGVGYSQRGYRLDFGGMFDDDPVVALGYVELPVAIVGHFDAGRIVHARGLVGGSASLLVDASETQFGEQRDLDDSFKGNDVAVLVGGGIEVFIGGRLLIVDLRYQIGLRNIAVVDADIMVASGPIHSRVFSVNVALAF